MSDVAIATAAAAATAADDDATTDATAVRPAKRGAPGTDFLPLQVGGVSAFVQNGDMRGNIG